MNEITRIAIDTSKSVFTLHGTDASGRAVLRRNLRRHDRVPFFARRPPGTSKASGPADAGAEPIPLCAISHKISRTASP